MIPSTSHPNASLAESLEGLRERLARPVNGLSPFSDIVVMLCAKFSAKLLKEIGSSPEVAALAFWCREAHLKQLKQEFMKLESENVVLVPRGTVFHIPPSNVATILAYGWLISILTGNKSIIRVSDKSPEIVKSICRVLQELLQEHAGGLMADTTALVTYGHDLEISSGLSSMADVRMIWGGDASVAAIRESRLPAHAFDVTFPDRISWAVIRSASYRRASANTQRRLADEFYGDAYSFDQMACSSPRTVIWCGTAEDCAAASEIFYNNLRNVIQQRGYEVDLGVHTNQLVQAFGAALDLPVDSYRRYGSHITVVHLSEPDSGSLSAWCGGGFFFHLDIPEVRAIATLAERKVQTVTHFGFSQEELVELARELNGRGIDRIVPVGQALVFNRFWDGYDLFQVLTRRVHIVSQRIEPPGAFPHNIGEGRNQVETGTPTE